ncbi:MULTISPECIES: FAD-dependent oxidoreductase [unclassified Agarivorans]|uniref:FAD-dependent oxidoreductase n=1 Tax=unclassified Agarivorans TaxID=2636026 RepID=UPI0026E2212B|nr:MULTISPECIES: FAD-dependent oxidoreductase [unclassified Agarivorans]MDO6687786.1 FAD-dependent oxidoreductase [Agarivorans sp. 3_MG-2023]MDO6717350.1 FAD-dependent oxidoreductase [Agarivorans sp. 2_MG-2023]
MKPNKLIVVAVLAVVVCLIWWFDLGQWLNFDTIKQSQASLQANVEQHFLISIIGYFFLYVFVTAFSIPGAALLTLLAGALFGVVNGVIMVSFASTIGASLAFIVARYLVRDSLEQRYAEKLKSINSGIEKEGAFYLLSLRLIPIFPFFLINLVMALTKLPLKTFYWVSQLGMFPATVVYVNAGTELAKLDSLSGILSPSLLVAFTLLGILPYISKAILNGIKQRKVYAPFNKPKTFDNNLLVIGAGAGGLVSSYIAAAVKAKVTLVEKHLMGGDCLNTGCVPSKALIRSAKFAYEAKNAENFGYEKVDAQANFTKVMERVHQVIKQVEPHDSVERYTKLGVNCVQGTAHIRSPWEVEIDGKTVTTQNIVIATGARPLVPPIPGLQDVDFLTSDTLWQLSELPKKLLVLGGGPIGCELTQSFARLGAQVTQIEMADHLLIREDLEASKLLEEQFTKEGIELMLGWKAISFHNNNQVQSVKLTKGEEQQEIEFDKVILALGRVANTKGFGLEELGVENSERGTVAVNAHLQTNFPNIYAVGDVAGPYQFTHFAAHQAWYAAVNALFGRFKKFKADYSVIPAATYTYPEVARVGINEQDAKLQGIAYEVTEFQLEELDRAIAEGATNGFIKVLTVPGKDKILGATIVAEHAGELLAEFTLAMKHGLGLNKILGTIHAYPTMMEANKYVAGEWKRNHAPEKVLSYLEKFHKWTRKA